MDKNIRWAVGLAMAVFWLTLILPGMASHLFGSPYFNLPWRIMEGGAVDLSHYLLEILGLGFGPFWALASLMVFYFVLMLGLMKLRLGDRTILRYSMIASFFVIIPELPFEHPIYQLSASKYFVS